MASPRLPVNEKKLDELGQALRSRLDRQISKRRLIEERWLTDLRQYHGRYSNGFEEILKKQEQETGSAALFVNITRNKCDAGEARVADMLFPSDDRNWIVGPTSSPELAESASSNQPLLLPGVGALPVDGRPVTVGEFSNAVLEKAKQAATGMQREIDDQLTEARYAAIARDVIRDAVQLGTGVIKGPVVVSRQRKVWQQVNQEVYELRSAKDRRPGIRRVSVWDFYPDMAASDTGDAEFFFERQRLRRKQLRRLAEQDGYLKARIRRVLEDETLLSRTTTEDQSRQRLREIADVYAVDRERSDYECWTYTGPISAEMAEAAGLAKLSALDEKEVEIQFIGSMIIKIVELALETDEHGYSVFNWVKADGSIFGYGLPYILRSAQEVAAKAWRAQLDNAAFSVGPQIVVDQKIVEPADGVWQLTPRKVWWKKDPSQPINAAFATFDIRSYQPELKDIFNAARELADEESALPRLMQGEMGNMPQQTATGMSMLINASNTFLRRVIKNWDDDVTVPLIRRFYDYNMQYHPDPSIKGDFEVDARGASTLMVKETQTQALLSLLQFAANPIFAPLFKPLALLRKTVEAQRLNPDDILYTEEEMKQREQVQTQQPPDLETQKLAFEKQQAQQQHDLKMLELSLKSDLSAEQINAKLHEVAMRQQGESERQDKETALKVTMGSGL